MRELSAAPLVVSLACAGLLASAGCDETDGGKKTAARAEGGKAAVEDATARAPAEDAGPALFAETPLEHQLTGGLMTGVQFLGWTSDSQLYALRVERGLDMGELGGSNAIVLREVRDARTGQLVASFRIDKAMGPSVEKNDPLRQAWAEARPGTEWEAWSEKRGMSDEGTPPETIALKVVVPPKSVPSLSSAKAVSRGIATELLWRSWDEPRNADERAARARMKGLDRSEATPIFEVALWPLAREGEQKDAGAEPAVDRAWTVLRLKSPYNLGFIDEARSRRESVIRGALIPHWSPDQRRVLWTVNWEPSGLNEEMAHQVGAFFSRTLGPQIKLVTRTRERAAQVVSTLEKLGHPITAVELKDDAPTAALVHYRGDAAREHAEAIAAALDTKAVTLEKPGWVHILVTVPDA